MCDCSLGKEENPSEPPKTLREVEERLRVDTSAKRAAGCLQQHQRQLSRQGE